MNEDTNILLRQCMKAGMPVRLSMKNDKFICIVEKVWITIEADTLEAAITEACTMAYMLSLKGTNT